ncbi:MAG TPA: hypothetical protein VFL03_05625 [Candidatus Limnocylindrales bacterium]|jgi:hypothetical protein|nr:hypothetical protein [Candidatus Limnocylindrales bacterium]
MDTDYDQLVSALQRAIVARNSLPPGTPARRRAECEANALMKRVAAMNEVHHPALAGTLRRPVSPVGRAAGER